MALGQWRKENIMGEMEKICKLKKEKSLYIKDIEQFNMVILVSGNGGLEWKNIDFERDNKA